MRTAEMKPPLLLSPILLLLLFLVQACTYIDSTRLNTTGAANTATSISTALTTKTGGIDLKATITATLRPEMAELLVKEYPNSITGIRYTFDTTLWEYKVFPFTATDLLVYDGPGLEHKLIPGCRIIGRYIGSGLPSGYSIVESEVIINSMSFTKMELQYDGILVAGIMAYNSTRVDYPVNDKQNCIHDVEVVLSTFTLHKFPTRTPDLINSTETPTLTPTPYPTPDKYMMEWIPIKDNGAGIRFLYDERIWQIISISDKDNENLMGGFAKLVHQQVEGCQIIVGWDKVIPDGWTLIPKDSVWLGDLPWNREGFMSSNIPIPITIYKEIYRIHHPHNGDVCIQDAEEVLSTFLIVHLP